MKDDDFKLLWGFVDRQTYKQTNRQTDICDCRVAFATEKSIYSLDQEEQGEVIMAEYREGWAARAEKVRIYMIMLMCGKTKITTFSWKRQNFFFRN